MKKGYRKRVKYNDPPGLVVTVENNNIESYLGGILQDMNNQGGNINTIHKDNKFQRRNTIVQEKVFKEVAFTFVKYCNS